MNRSNELTLKQVRVRAWKKISAGKGSKPLDWIAGGGIEISITLQTRQTGGG